MLNTVSTITAEGRNGDVVDKAFKRVAEIEEHMSSHLKTVQPTKNIYTKLEDVLYPKPPNLSELNNFPSIQHIPNKNTSKLNSNKPKAQQPQTTKYINKPYLEGNFEHQTNHMYPHL